jgi:hypothetical protein
MAFYRLVINTDNSAFSGDPLREIARILDEESTALRTLSDMGDTEMRTNFRLCDLNGNKVGASSLAEF